MNQHFCQLSRIFNARPYIKSDFCRSLVRDKSVVNNFFCQSPDRYERMHSPALRIKRKINIITQEKIMYLSAPNKAVTCFLFFFNALPY